jgi:hypothetical protein
MLHVVVASSEKLLNLRFSCFTQLGVTVHCALKPPTKEALILFKKKFIGLKVAENRTLTSP